MNKTRGQTLIEFALVIPIVIFMITVFIDLGRAVFYYASLDNAAREGTRYAIVNPIYTTAQQNLVIARARAFTSGMDPAAINVTVTRAIPIGLVDYFVTVVVSYTFQPVTPGLKEILGASSGITLSARSRAMVSPRYNRANP
jgi:Flp pilus assembly protein TadG